MKLLLTVITFVFRANKFTNLKIVKMINPIIKNKTIIEIFFFSYYTIINDSIKII